MYIYIYTHIDTLAKLAPPAPGRVLQVVDIQSITTLIPLLAISARVYEQMLDN